MHELLHSRFTTRAALPPRHTQARAVNLIARRNPCVWVGSSPEQGGHCAEHAGVEELGLANCRSQCTGARVWAHRPPPVREPTAHPETLDLSL